MQIGERHKVACHFAGRLGDHPREPVTTSLLGVGSDGQHEPGATPMTDGLVQPGYSDTWIDLDGRTPERA